ncbi:competence/damage-inducible protein cinA [Labedella gwakjiensis]|uniref:Competence/damage-inducible protein cinA n=1 Tax=Labedella gwakjiensis TaxID=390269 RepID=A0A2P8GYJ9_9MICO|nr:nicotinamide-nucleotide amidohydrolase family protein [Labedella gwakjiensis]PSL39046.1 competence/damage-inducible protein cinA [Labedella gwakjiensis]
MTVDAAELISSLADAGQTVAIAESLTGGAVSAALIAPAGASAVVRGAVVAYDTELKASLLGVDRDLLDSEGPVHPEVARQMAIGVRVALATSGGAATIGIATTGVAGPASQGGREPGTVFVAISHGDAVEVREANLAGDRSAVRAATVDLALEMLGNIPR